MEAPKEIKQINEVTWEIPTTFKKGMLVPARIIATRKLLEQMDKGVFEQITNVAMLPGIVGYAIAMPDAHFGYGFPVGGVAAMDLKEGVISPGGLGFDLNCLAKGSRILTKYGYTKKIEDFEKEFYKEKLITMQLDKKAEEISSPCMFMVKKISQEKVYKITLASGKEIIATGDHPLFTQQGMLEIEEIDKNQEIAVFPFEGVPYESPREDIIVGEEEFKKFISNRSKTSQDQIIKTLKNKRLLPLKRTSEKLPYLIKLVAFSTGDGNLTLTEKTKAASFYADKEDLEEIGNDIHALGFELPHIHARIRKHTITTRYDTVRFTREENSISSQSSSLILLLNYLGAPLGKKTEKEFDVPSWLHDGPLWHKRLYLASLFGAEMSSPSTIKNLGYTFNSPVLSINKHENYIESGITFLKGIKKILEEFGVRTREISIRNEYDGITGTTYRLRLIVSDTSILDLFRFVNFEYNKRKRFLANVALQYLILKKKIVLERNLLAKNVRTLYENGMSSNEIYEVFSSKFVNKRFLQRSIFEKRKTSSRISSRFLSFNDYLEERAIQQSGMVWDVIEKKELIDYKDYVYDFTVDHDSHNFIANSVVTSNCGMRILTTNLKIDDVKPKIKELVNELYKLVPPGVGARSLLRVTNNQLDELSVSGVKWCMENGYAWKDDMQKIEEHGAIAGGDGSKISEKAKERGRSQLGTLGSGNHYLEVQFVSAGQIYDEKIASAFGVHDKDQICIMVHCGSRGFGHQIATDYLKLFDRAMEKYNIKIPDRELSCAPYQSQEGQDYYKAMIGAANFAFANRQLITYNMREAFKRVFHKPAEDMEMQIVYDVAHNIGKIERYKVDGKVRRLLIHRKGATRAFGPGNEELWDVYKKFGQPVIVGGSMETGSYLLVGTKKAEEETFGSTLHGSGRTMSRTQAKKMVRGDKLQKDMEARGIYVKAASFSGLAEESGISYKDINEVVKSVEDAGISKAVCSLKPLGNIKGNANMGVFLMLSLIVLIALLFSAVL